tara:strand:- start:273 stop:539 length:267 start_codon:yes stop_codon:yes gene_type:complete
MGFAWLYVSYRSKRALSQPMLTKYAERFVLRSCSQGLYLGVNASSSQIEVRDSVEDAWLFHTHEGAVTHARWIGEVHGETPDVVKLTV